MVHFFVFHKMNIQSVMRLAEFLGVGQILIGGWLCFHGEADPKHLGHPDWSFIAFNVG